MIYMDNTLIVSCSILVIILLLGLLYVFRSTTEMFNQVTNYRSTLGQPDLSGQSNFVQLWFNYSRFAREYMKHSARDPFAISANITSLTPIKLKMNSNQYDIATSINKMYPNTVETIWPILENHINIFVSIVNEHVKRQAPENPILIPSLMADWDKNTITLVKTLHSLNQNYNVEQLKLLLSQITTGLFVELNLIVKGLPDDNVYIYVQNSVATFAGYLAT